MFDVIDSIVNKIIINQEDYFLFNYNELSIRQANYLFSWEELSRIINMNIFDYPRIKFIRDNKVVNREFIIQDDIKTTYNRKRYNYNLINEIVNTGGSIIVNGVHFMNENINCLTNYLLYKTKAKYVHANIYASWGTDHAFQKHWDDHDSIIIQISGEKEWKLYGITDRYPVKNKFPKKENVPNEIINSIVLKSGDILYIPRGYWHDVYPNGSPSLHITIGINRYMNFELLKNNLESLLMNKELFRKPYLEKDSKCIIDSISNELSMGNILLSEESESEFELESIDFFSMNMLNQNFKLSNSYYVMSFYPFNLSKKTNNSSNFTVYLNNEYLVFPITLFNFFYALKKDKILTVMQMYELLYKDAKLINEMLTFGINKRLFKITPHTTGGLA